MFKTAKIIAAASVFAFAGSAAIASDSEDIIVNEHGNRTVMVEYGDLNLQSEAGRDALEGRIRSAVRRVCEHGMGQQTLRQQINQRECARVATSTALAAIDREGATRLAVSGLPATSAN